jgi:hypothetical protein
VEGTGRVPDSEAVREGLGATDRDWEEVLVELGVSDPVTVSEGVCEEVLVELGVSEGVCEELLD